MSDTPRTDSYVYKFPGCQREPRLIDFARRLERELAEAQAEIDIIEHDANVLIGDIKAELACKNRLVEQMRESLKACAEFIHYYDQEHNIGDGKVLEQAIAALRAADGGE
jgi:hypothetical protein